jgi:Ca-activated chloride channel family protein
VNLSISGVRVEDIYPYPLPDLFAGSQLVVAGRYRSGGAAALTLSGQVNGASQSYNYRGLTFVERGGQEFIARLWAQRKIGYLLSQIRLGGAKDELVKEVIALGTRYGIATPYTSFLVQEPGVAVIRDGVTPPGPVPVGGVSAPTAAPAAAPRSGQGAVEKAMAEQQLKSSEQAAAAPGQANPTLRQVGNKAFILREGAWVDSTFDATKVKAEAIVFGSENYFRLLSTHPEIGRYLALGDRVTVVLDGKAYAIAPEQPAPSQR